MSEKITRTWKIEEDIARMLAEFSARTHLGQGDAVQLGAWLAMHVSPNDRQAMLELMDQRKPIPVRLETEDLDAADLARATRKALDGRPSASDRRRRTSSK